MRTTTLLKWCFPFIAGMAFSADDSLINKDEIKRPATMVTIEIVDKSEPRFVVFPNCFHYLLVTSSPLSYMAYYGSQPTAKKKYTKDKDA